jgi:hypothetical protein
MNQKTPLLIAEGRGFAFVIALSNIYMAVCRGNLDRRISGG